MISVLHRPEMRCVLVLGGSPPTTEVAFIWDAVVGATSYVLQVGSATTLSDIYDSNVGNVLTSYLPLATGTYYSRVVPVGAGSTTDEQTVVVA